MEQNKLRAFDFIMRWEGPKITNDKDDKGGLTAMFGLTLGTMQKLEMDLNHDGKVDAKDVYLVKKEDVFAAFCKAFWDKMGCDQLPGGTDLCIVDSSWNHGTGKTKEFVKAGYGGPYERLLFRRFLLYKHIIEKNPSQEKYRHGWENRLEDCLAEADKCVK